MRQMVPRSPTTTVAIRNPLTSVARWLMALAPVALMVYATILWFVTLPHIDLGRMDDLGLISVLPLSTFVALIILTTSFCMALGQRSLRTWLVLAHVVVLIFMLYGIAALVEEVPRFAHTWHKVGVTEYISRTGQVDPTIDHNFNWPGFYIMSAFMLEIAGLDSAITFAGWVPVFLNLLYLGPLVMILRSSTGDQRLVWLGLWFFYLTNWISQDYFSPQGLTYFLYLVILAVLMTWFKVTAPESTNKRRSSERLGRLNNLSRKIGPWLAVPDAPNVPSTPMRRAGLIIIVVLISMVLVASHQLTPFAVLASISALVVFNRCSARGMPVLVSVLVGTWMAFVAVTYLAGHLSTQTENLGQVEASVASNVIGRLRGSPQHVLVVNMRLVMTLAIWLLALFGGIRSLRNGYWDLTYAVWAASLLPFLVSAHYGGEMLMRIYMFALPPIVFFAAALFFTTPRTGRSWRTPLAIGLVSVALFVGFFVTRYGNERMDYFTPDEIAAIDHAYTIAEENSLLLSLAPYLPWKSQDYEKFRYRSLTDMPSGEHLEISDLNPDTIAKLMQNKKYPAAYLIITRSQKAGVELLGKLPSGTVERLEHDLENSPKLELVFANDDGKVFVLANRGAGIRR